ncbi:unnamed protein product [Cyprideis torosa]|uniref:Uncharacterized protein n=1 Tax=Cyprideis torosa TaxID=163714 RepID=A0A7R8WP64_9CRUS|nr:unnamed protein product [Cyprideis torosa]CAG0901169.1 unnamed protein product [Cyprideis torosa]
MSPGKGLLPCGTLLPVLPPYDGAETREHVKGIRLHPGTDLSTLNANLSSVWVKIISSWVCIGLYCWTLVAPLLFPDRDFGTH